MDFLKIGKNKLKISLNREDILDFHLEKIGADTDLSPYSEAIFSIVDIAEEQGIFSANEEKLLLQFYPLSEGGELFVTKLSVMTEAQKSVICRAQNLTVAERKQAAYLIENLADAAALARSISSRQAPPEKSAIYLLDEGEILLELEEQKCATRQTQYPEISEFATKIPKDTYLFLREHSMPLLPENALKMLSEITEKA